jgi:hypothetical protein
MQVSPQETRCKCCDSISRLCGVVDFSCCGADYFAGRKVDPYAGVPIYYYCCDSCGFIFTRAMDDWTSQEFADFIYNDDYVRHDPDYLSKRPLENAQLIANNFPEMAQTSMLDFGSGLGLLEKELKSRGFVHVDSFDPYVEAAATRDDLLRHYQTIVAFEVFEHHPQPHMLMEDLVKFLDDEGAILFSTLLVSKETLAEGSFPPLPFLPRQRSASEETRAGGIATWWYCTPRNGHISFFTPRALAVLAQRHGLVAGSFSAGLHFFYRGQMPSWIKRLNRNMH